MRLPILLSLLAAGFAPLGAQTLPEALALVPADATRVETFRDAATLDARIATTLGRVAPPPKDPMVQVYQDLGVPAGARAAGPVVVAYFPGKNPKIDRSVAWVPAKNFKAFARAVKAKPAGKLMQVKRGKTTYSLAAQGAFAVVSSDAALLRTALAAPRSQDFPALATWLEGHDLGIAGGAAGVVEAMKGLRAGIEGGGKAQPDANAAAAKAFLLPLLDQAEASVHLAALGADFPKDGSIRGEAKAFFKPGSPLALTCGALAAPAGHALDGLSPAGSILAVGGPIFPGFAKTAEAGQDPAVSQASAAILRNQTGFALSLGIPPADGPILGGLRWLARFNDVAAYFKQARDLAQAQNPALAALGLRSEFTPDILPGVPSFSQTFIFEGKAVAGLPSAQVKVMATLLVGSADRATLSVGQADPHTIVGVLGDAATLKAALAGYGPGFATDPGVATADALLPAGALWRMYLDPANARALARSVMASFTGKTDGLPELPAVPPVAFAVRADAGGIALDGAVAPATLDALVKFFRGLDVKKPQAEPAAEQ